MAKLAQIQVRFDPLQDRLLMRLNTDDKSEYALWLTRRYVGLLWPALRRMVDADPVIQQQADAGARSSVLSFQHQQAVDNADFSTGFDEQAVETPLGQEPLLAVHLQVRNLNDGNHCLVMKPETGEGVELVLDHQLLHGLCKLFADAIRQAEWGFDVRLTDVSQVVPDRVN